MPMHCASVGGTLTCMLSAVSTTIHSLRLAVLCQFEFKDTMCEVHAEHFLTVQMGNCWTSRRSKWKNSIETRTSSYALHWCSPLALSAKSHFPFWRILPWQVSYCFWESNNSPSTKKKFLCRTHSPLFQNHSPSQGRILSARKNSPLLNPCDLCCVTS